MIFKNFVKKALRLQKVLSIESNILGINYSSSADLPTNFYQDTLCTALARSFTNGEKIIINNEYPQLCPGGDYFLKAKKISDKDAIDVYVDAERVFKNRIVCKKFLKSLPKFPSSLIGKNISIAPLNLMKKAIIIMALVTPAQAGRIIGLLNYKKYSEIKIIPNQSTCISVFAPLVSNQPHINLIDYYDRYHQGVVAGKKIWPEGNMIISMTIEQFNDVCNNINVSPQGSFVPKLSPKEVDAF